MKFCIFAFIICTFGFSQHTWIETTQEDFADGTYERNIYASHDDGGTIEFVSRFDLNNDGYIDIFTADVYGPFIKIYWGSASGYSSSHVTLFPTTGGSNCDAADVNNDGYADFIVCHQYNQRVTIYWGNATGPNPNFYQDFPALRPTPQAVCAADPNKDGYIDIITSHEYTPGHGAIIWGDSTGYNISNRTDLPMSWGVPNIEVADFNKDGWFDILFVDYYTDSPGLIRIFWGSSSGYSSGNALSLTAPLGAHGASIADLNGDNFLDLVCQGWYDVSSYIFWGSQQGYSQSNVQILYPGYCYGGSAIDYMNDDEYLDIVYHRGGYGSTQQRIYWGSASGYSDANVTPVGLALETTGGFIADMNYDGAVDIFCNTITPGSQSYIFWGPNYTAYQTLPVSKDHKAMFREIGNTYNRKYYEEYISSIFNAGIIADWGIVEWEATTPTGTAVLFSIRSGNVPIPDGSWSSWYEMNNGGSVPDVFNAQYLQYKTKLVYTNPCYFPRLEEVCVTYNSEQIVAAAITIKPEVINLKNHGRFSAFITLQPNYNPADINPATVQCEGAFAVDEKITPLQYIAQFNVQDLVGVEPGEAVQFLVSGEMNSGTPFFGVDTIRVIDNEHAMLNCTPNPLYIKADITFLISDKAAPPVKIYNIYGALIKDLTTTQIHNGLLKTTWDRTDNIGRRVPAGIYWIKIETDNDFISKKVIVLDK